MPLSLEEALAALKADPVIISAMGEKLVDTFELLKTAEGQYVVIVGDELIGPLETDEEAERAGYERFGLGPLYIQQLLTDEAPALVTRPVIACRT